jgi:hypothetical protein
LTAGVTHFLGLASPFSLSVTDCALAVKARKADPSMKRDDKDRAKAGFIGRKHKTDATQ